MQRFEVELRALLTKKHHDALIKHFNTVTKGEIDNAKAYTFLTSSLNIKVKEQITKKTAKITVKKGAEYQQQADEIELPIQPAHVKQAVQLITALGFPKHIPSLQKRVDYKIDDITVSLKHETNWKYHIEAEIMVGTKKQIPAAKKRLEEFFQNLHITPMTEEENRSLINSIITRYGLNKI